MNQTRHRTRGRKSAIVRLLSLLIVIYQRSLSVVLGPRCRFYPSCSHYAKDCLAAYPLPVALKKIGGRLLRCHPFHPGGIDLP
ncbi:MAG: membrane protein insertion efficiency factor YidD [Deltaproteobacteria bacterium]|nr:membrane protein insertion efficiency factor YidD [Deltaproteobacteria bacterium]